MFPHSFFGRVEDEPSTSMFQLPVSSQIPTPNTKLLSPPPFPFPRFSTTTVSSPFKVKQQKEPHTENVTNSFSPAPVERSPIPPLSEPNTYEDQLISERAAQAKQEIIKQSTSPLLHDFESCSSSSSPPMSPPLKEQSHKPSTKDSDDDGYAKSLRNVANTFLYNC